MSKVLGPDFVALQVRDLAASQRFYTDVLALEVDPAGPPHAVVFRTTPVPFAIRAPLVDLAAVKELGWGVSLWLHCDDTDGLCARVEAQGLPILQRPFDGPFGRTCTFRDPDGYTITLHSRAA